jgi:hypothetical protein
MFIQGIRSLRFPRTEDPIDMSDASQWMTRLEEILTNRRAKVARTDSGLHVQFGRSLTAAEADIDPGALWGVLQNSPAGQHERLIQGFASGVHHVLLEPRRSRAADWEYKEAAGKLMPNLEVFTFRLGASAAGAKPWTLEFHEDLIVAYFIDLNIGTRVLSQEQFERWSVSASRVTSAARSILYHKSRNAAPRPLDDSERIEILHLGDDYDAMRSIVVVDLFFGDFKDEFRFSMPSQDSLLFVRGDEAADLEALREATDARFDAAEYPLSRSIYTFERGQPILDENRSRS